MNLSKVKDVVFISIVISLSLALFVNKNDKREKEVELKTKTTALNECVEDIVNQCKSIVSYAIVLEKENARLNKVCKQHEN